MNPAEKFQIVAGSRPDYHHLEKYHYIKQRVHFPTNIWKIIAKGPRQQQFPDPIAVIVFAMPLINCKARNIATEHYFEVDHSPSVKLKRVNSKIRYAARLIVDPRFRQIGIGQWLIEESLKLMDIPIIEALTPIDFTNKMLLKAGFRQYNNPRPYWYRRLTRALETAGITEKSFEPVSTFIKRLNKLTTDLRKTIDYEIEQFLRHFNRANSSMTTEQKCIFVARKLDYPQAYFIWFNPRNSYLS